MSNRKSISKQVDRLYQELKILCYRAEKGIYPTICAIWFEDRIELLLNNRKMLNLLTAEQLESINRMIEKLTKLDTIKEEERMNLITYHQLFDNTDIIGENV